MLCSLQGLCYAERTMAVSNARSPGALCLHRFTVRARGRLFPVRMLRYVLGAALFITLAAAPAWARFATRFQAAASEAPLIIRAKVLSKSPSAEYEASGGMDVQLAVERTLVGPSVGRRVTLTMPNMRHSAPLEEGRLYLLLLENPTSLYSDHNSCGIMNYCEVVNGKVPRFQSMLPPRPSLTDYLLGHQATLAEAETAIITARCHDGQICPDDSKSHRLAMFLSRLSPQHLLMFMAALALAGYSWWLARSRAAQVQDGV